MAVVWRARDQTLGADVAVKLLRPGLARDETARARFRAEAMNTRRARNDHVVEIHELILDANPPFFVMPLLSGGTLSERIRRTGGVDFGEAAEILAQLLRGLAVAHDQGIVHRDIKPHNVFLERPPGIGAARVVLLDFGIAFDDRRDAALTSTGLVVGTPAYMAPEVSLGQPGADAPTADVYSAALVAYEMITGALPRALPRPTPLHETVRGIEAGVPAGFGRAVHRALDPDPTMRQPNARALLDDLLASHGQLSAGELVDDRYRIVELIGEGGMATVHRAEDTRLGGQVAIKMLAAEREDDPEVCGRFRDECEILMRMSHPHMIGVRAVGAHHGRPYCALDLVDGRTLADTAADLGWRGVVRTVAQVAAALDDAHVAGVVHRDVKADNILIDPAGDAVLIDFGVARFGGPWRTRTGVVVGTPGAEAPEQVAGGHLSGLTDQWGLAAVCYSLLSGRVPGEAVDVADTQERALQTMENVAMGLVVPLGELRAELSDALCAAVMRGLSPEPADRYRSASAFAVAVQRASNGARLPGETATRRATSAWIAGGVVTALFAALIAGAIAFGGGPVPEGEHAAVSTKTSELVDMPPQPSLVATEPAPAPAKKKAPKRAKRERRARTPSDKTPASEPASAPTMPALSVDPASMMNDAERMARQIERAAAEMDPPDDSFDDIDVVGPSDPDSDM